MPKLPPPPRMAQNKSSFCDALTDRCVPSALTRSAEITLSQLNPNLPISQPRPPPRVKPQTPVEEITPPVVANWYRSHSRSNSANLAPPCATAEQARGFI